MNVTAAELDRIIEHMNEDHADALVIYAHAYASRPDVTEARMVDLQSDAVVLALPGEEQLSVPLVRPIDTAHDAHRVLVDMAIQGRQRLTDQNA